jgi:tRNA pseudouridine55 synthase
VKPGPAAEALAARAPSGWSGLLPMDKPAGVTSHDVVDRVRRRLRVKQAGHLGTLDPGASGLLVVAIGAATRCAIVWQGGTKTYEGVARFGVVTDTQDTQGRVLETREPAVDEAGIRAASAALTGDLLQVPPMVSALKHQGRRLYDLARRGETVAREPRPVRVDGWEWLSFEGADAGFRVRCSGGTYVRTLVHDLGAGLGCGAALAALRRTRSEPFTIEGACPWRELDDPEPAGVLGRYGIGLDQALGVLPALVLDTAGVEALGHGRAVTVAPGGAPVGAGERSVVFRDGGGRALALGELQPGGTEGEALARPHVVFPWAVREGGAS